MGRISKADIERFKMVGFQPLELNEGNVQAIFNRCLATENSGEISGGILFPPSHGYEQGSEKMIPFDTDALLKNKKSIEYLYGQLQLVHTSRGTGKTVTIDDYTTTYSGKIWTRDKGVMLQFLYLGATKDTLLVSPFQAEDSTNVIAAAGIKPTLSPKDPNFPAWWEAHKGEWEA